MKNIFKLISILLVACLMTGCVNYNIDMKIDKGGKVELSTIYAVNKSLMDNSTEDTTNGSNDSFDKSKLEANGFKVEDYNTDELEGYKITKTYDINDVSKDSAISIELGDIITGKFNDAQLFQITKNNMFGKTYKANFTFNADTSSDFGDDSADDSDNDWDFNDNDAEFNYNKIENKNYSKLMTKDEDTTENSNDFGDSFNFGSLSESLSISYKVTLPSKAISHNADTVDETTNTYAWNVQLGSVKNINYEFQMKTNTLLYLIIGGSTLLLAGVAILVVPKLIKKNKKTNNQISGNNVPTNISSEPVVEPVQPIVESGESNIWGTQPTVEPVQPVQAMPVQQPTQPVVQVQSQVMPAQSVQQPVQPTQQPVQPTQQPVQPIQQPVQPVQQPVQPQVVPVQPVQETFKPTNEPMQQTTPVEQNTEKHLTVEELLKPNNQ